MIFPSALLLNKHRPSNIEHRILNHCPIRRTIFDVRCSLLCAGVATLCLALAGCKSPLDNVDIKDVYGPTGRHAKNVVDQAKRDAEGSAGVGIDEFNAAKKLYEEQKYA